MAKIELIGGYIGFMLIIEIAKIIWRTYLNYACYRDYQDEINRRP